jgi:hypothetical protein
MNPTETAHRFYRFNNDIPAERAAYEDLEALLHADCFPLAR